VSKTGDTISGSLTVTGTVSAGGDVIAYSSDERLKQHITRLDNIEAIIECLGGYQFEWRDIPNLPMKGRDIGLVAQHLEHAGLGDIFLAPAPFDHPTPGESASGQGYKTICYNKLHALWAEALHHQQHTIRQLLETVRDLQTTVEALQKATSISR